MGKCWWIASLAISSIFPIQILLPFPIFKLPPNFISQCYRPQIWQFYFSFSSLSVSSIHEVVGNLLSLRVGRSRDPYLQRPIERTSLNESHNNIRFPECSLQSSQTESILSDWSRAQPSRTKHKVQPSTKQLESKISVLLIQGFSNNIS